jgi:ATP-binding protein involved in chromosome partitioning
MGVTPDNGGGTETRIAIPVADGRLAEHFGHCEEFMVFSGSEQLDSPEVHRAPPHRPGLLPSWLAELGVKVVIAGGMGRRAQDLFRQSGIEVVVGAAGSEPRAIVKSFLDGTLDRGGNPCDH